MGSFYGNVLVARACEAVVPLLDGQGLRGFALPAGPEHTVIYPDPETSGPDLAGPLSKLLAAPALGMYLFDSDVLVMTLYENGDLSHFYDSFPGYFDEPEDDGEDPPSAEEPFEWPEPTGADPDAFLPLAAGPVDRAALESVLRCIPIDPEDGEDGRYVFAEAQHFDAMDCLRLNAPRLTTGYRYLTQGDLPYGTTADDLVLLGGTQRPTART
ncbi:hypothetical protein GCM10014715_31710 [Streptomyces spiralis]|uniref:Uncharacterized protein n=1 Tax=Streptomyces spiralis TaxID=66376 RepID=A0A918ZXZ4_9ACTN|nr:hypothetical protein [Streptomyces spiralis]GHE74757.1 hypothetical protein GCM10014715_31710 [Streptomyces spiralis]